MGMTMCSIRLSGGFDRAAHPRVIDFVESADLAHERATLPRGFQSVRRVLDNNRFLRLDSQTFAGAQIHLWMRLWILYVLIADQTVEQFENPAAAQHEFQALANGIRADSELEAVVLELVNHEFFLKDRCAAAQDFFARVLLFDLVHERVQAARKTFLHAQHLQFFARGQSIVSGEMLVARNGVTEQSERAVQRFVMPLGRIHEHTVEIEENSFYPHRFPTGRAASAAAGSHKYLSPFTHGTLTTTVVTSVTASKSAAIPGGMRMISPVPISSPFIRARPETTSVNSVAIL